MSFNVQARAVSSSLIHASDGIAVSIAIASRVTWSARTWTFVASGPMTRQIRSTRRLLAPGREVFAQAEPAIALADELLDAKSIDVLGRSDVEPVREPARHDLVDPVRRGVVDPPPDREIDANPIP